MTDKEWEDYQKRKYQTDMGESEAFVVANSVLSPSSLKRDNSSPFTALKSKDLSLQSKQVMNDWIGKFCVDFNNKFVELYPKATEEDFIDVLEAFSEYCFQFKTIRLFSELSEAFQEMVVYEYSKM